MWVPAGVLEAIGAMMALRNLMRLSSSPRLVKAKKPVANAIPASTQRSSAQP
jgi:putative membrane protein